jgi:KUP system potassium uptake protein
MPDRKVGDFRFILIQEQLSYESELNFWDSLIFRSKLFIKRFTVSPSRWFGLDTSDVYIEKVPLFIGYTDPVILRRIKNPIKNKKNPGQHLH